MFPSKRKKISIERDLYDRLKAAADRDGYASVDEMIIHVLERTASLTPQERDEQDVEEQLRGLGYLE